MRANYERFLCVINRIFKHKMKQNFLSQTLQKMKTEKRFYFKMYFRQLLKFILKSLRNICKSKLKKKILQHSQILAQNVEKCDTKYCKRMLNGSKHTSNPFTLRTFFLQKSTSKKLLTFSLKFYGHFKIILQHLLKLFKTHYSLKRLSDFDLQDFDIFFSLEKYIFYDFSKIIKFDLPLDQPILTKC